MSKMTYYRFEVVYRDGTEVAEVGSVVDGAHLDSIVSGMSERDRWQPKRDGHTLFRPAHSIDYVRYCEITYEEAFDEALSSP